MNIQSKLPSFMGDNVYEFILIDEKTNKIKQKIVSHNLVTNSFWEGQNKRRGETSSSWYSTGAPTKVEFGTGKGDPAITDTELFSRIWTMSIDYNKVTHKVSEDKTIGEATIKIILPANGNYIADITEVGLRSDSGGIFTHCMITDAEGNPIAIHKTADDKLEANITYRITIPKVSGNFTFLPVDEGTLQWIYSRFGGTTGGIFWHSGMSLIRNKQPIFTNGSEMEKYGIGKTGASKSFEIKKVTYNTQRMEASVGNNHYYFCLSINGIGYYSLPNQEVFPKYNITGINIGIGDGETLSFKNPLNYFVKDSDIIYINGQPKKRNVDYTIDSDNNFDMLNELSAGNWIKKIYSEADNIEDRGVSLDSAFPFFVPSEEGQYGERCNRNLTGKLLKLNIPMYIELKENKKVNTCYIRNVKCGKYDSSNISIKLEYSQNGQEYKEIFTSDIFDSTSGKCFNFDTIEAIYWKITLLSSSRGSEYACWVNAQKSRVFPFLGYVGDDQITFKVPPAKDDIITMDVQMDVPFKNENYSIDTSATLEFI